MSNAVLQFQPQQWPVALEGRQGRGEILQLRARLREYFPLAVQGESGPGALAAEPELHWGVPLLDGGGLAPAMLAEVVCGAGQAGGETLLAGLLAGAAAQGLHTALVDGTDGFDPCSFGPAEAGRLFARLLWVRCQAVAQVVRAADLLLRDGNVPLVVLDLQASPVRDLQQQPAHVWYRLRALAEQSRATCVALTPQRAIAAAQLRLDLEGTPTIEELATPRAALIGALRARITRQRRLEMVGTHEERGRLVG